MTDLKNKKLNEVQLVRIKNPYATLENENTQKIFTQMLALKKVGYSSAYGEDSLPLGVEDFISDHLLLCFKKNLQPIMGIRATDINTCRLYKIKFPPFEILDPQQNNLHYKAIEEIIDDCDQRAVNLGYSGGWTIDPRLRSDRELIGIAKEITEAVMYFHYSSSNIKEVVGGAVTNYKVDVKLHNPLGFENIIYKGEELPPIDCKLIKGNNVIWQHLKKFTSGAMERAETYLSMWESKLDITPNEASQAFRKAA